MVKARTFTDKILLVGSALGTASLFVGWLAERPNRLASGSILHLWDAFGPADAAAIGILWFSTFLLSLFQSRSSKIARIAPGVIATVTLVLTLLLTGAAARRLLEGADSAARISLSGGFWLNVSAVGIVVFGSIRRLSGWLKYAIASAGPLCTALLLTSGWLNSVSLLIEYEGYRDRFWVEALQHVKLTAISVAVATAIGTVLGVWASRNRIAKGPIFFVTNTVQTIPSLALFGLIIAPLSALSFAYPALRDIGIRGVGVAPAIIALIIYSLLPVVQNTYTGISSVDRAAVDAGRGMGMSRWQIFRSVEAPLAAPLVLEGIRTASVQAVGLTTVAAIIGAGGFGWFVFRGIGQAATDLIILGAIPIIVLAVIVDGLMTVLIRLGTPKGVQRREPSHG